MAPLERTIARMMVIIFMMAVLITVTMAAPIELSPVISARTFDEVAENVQRNVESDFKQKAKRDSEKLNLELFHPSRTLMPSSLIDQIFNTFSETVKRIHDDLQTTNFSKPDREFTEMNTTDLGLNNKTVIASATININKTDMKINVTNTENKEQIPMQPNEPTTNFSKPDVQFPKINTADPGLNNETVIASATINFNKTDMEINVTNTENEEQIPVQRFYEGETNDEESRSKDTELGRLLSDLHKSKKELMSCEEKIQKKAVYFLNNPEKADMEYLSTIDSPKASRSSSFNNRGPEIGSEYTLNDDLGISDTLGQVSSEDLVNLDEFSGVQDDLALDWSYQDQNMMPVTYNGQDVLFDKDIKILDYSDLNLPLSQGSYSIPLDPWRDLMDQLLKQFIELGNSRDLHAPEEVLHRLKEEIEFTKQGLFFCQFADKHMNIL